LKKYVVNEKNTLQKFTDNVCASASFRFRILLKEGRIRVNGKKQREDIPLSVGDEVCYFLSPKEEAKTGFRISYEDENVLIADKESGVNSEAVDSALRERGESYFIHRLDRNTAGLMAFAKTPQARDELLAAFRSRLVTKIYFALVVGKTEKHHAVEEAYLIKDPSEAHVRISASPVGEKIITEYEMLSFGAETSLLKITLHTGKTHQIRAHMAFLGHPVAGDMKYGDVPFNRAHHVTRQCLIAKELAFHFTGELAYLNGKKFISSAEISEIF